jgi:hypothetical protein
MVYTPTTWSEMSMSTAVKLTALDNLETLYTQAVSYIDAITHATSYYTDAQAGARYFTAVTDGTGTGLIAATLDGYTVDEIIAAGTPSGNICLWSGSEASIPVGFYLCNGSNGTPDLRNRFVPGAGSHYTKAETGGANTVTTTGTVTIAGHVLTAAEIAKHTHGTITDNYSTAPASTSLWTYGNTYPSAKVGSDVARNTGYTGDGGSHTHSASWTGTSDLNKRPPYYALCFIMKG